MKKIALTVTATLGLVSPAVAVPSNTSATFPANGFMLEDYTYTNQAVYANMGVYSDSVAANANYNDCPAGYWCDESGQHACSDLGGGYDNAAAGAMENTQCYRACTVDAANIAHAATVTGNDYYGTGTDTCSAATCENGYHVYSTSLADTIGDVASSIIGYRSISGNGLAGNISTFNLTENGTFGVTYQNNKGTVKGRAHCSTRGVSNPWHDDSNYTFADDHFVTTLPDSTGRYCYCTADEYTPVDGSQMSLSGLWVFQSGFNVASDCAYGCAYSCASDIGYTHNSGLAFRAAVLGSLTDGSDACAPNTISITWGGASQNDIDANNAGSCVYGGEIRTPVAAAVIPGKTFVGWKFVRPSQGGE